MIYRINRVNILNIWTLYDSAPVKKMLFPFAIWRKKKTTGYSLLQALICTLYIYTPTFSSIHLILL